MKLVLALAFLISTQLFAAEGVILVLEAPLLRQPSMDALVKQTVRRGDKIFIHDQHFNASPWESTSNASERVQIIDQVYDEEFYQTISSDGQPAYIQAKYVKVIYQDVREEGDPVARYKIDPTDYRLEEPLPEDYPLSARDKKKASALFMFGTNTKSSYPFAGQITDEKYKQSLGLQLIYVTKVDYDLFDRFYFGLKVGYDNYDVEQAFNNQEAVKQSLGRFSAGPFISYDIYKTLKHRFTTFANISLNYHRAYLTYDAINEQEEERSFTAWSFTPEIGANWQWMDVVPEVDFVVGAHLIAQPSTELTASKEGVGNFWNQEQDSISLESGLRAMFTIGIQSRY